jgi:hypothetical protein
VRQDFKDGNITVENKDINRVLTGVLTIDTLYLDGTINRIPITCQMGVQVYSPYLEAGASGDGFTFLFRGIPEVSGCN